MKAAVMAIGLILALSLAMAGPTAGTVRADGLASEEDCACCSVSGMPTDIYVEHENLVLAVGSDAIHSHDLTKGVYKAAWKSDELRDLRRTFEDSGYEIIDSQSAIAINVSAGGALVIVPTALEADPSITEKLVAIVDVEEQVVLGTQLGSEVELGSHVTCYWFFCVDWCSLGCAAAIASCLTGCVAACCAYPPICLICGTILCPLCMAGYDPCYNACVDYFH